MKGLIKILEETGRKDSTQWLKAKEDLADVYLTIGRYDNAIEITSDIMPLKKTALEKARTYCQIGLAFFKKGDFEESEKNLANGLALLGYRIPVTKKQVLLSLIKELCIHLPLIIFQKF